MGAEHKLQEKMFYKAELSQKPYGHLKMAILRSA
jgi:hypothetical protein